MSLRPCWVEIRTSALEANFRFLQSVSPEGAELLAIVKADAYGHGLALCAPAALRAGARWLGVTTVEEGMAARALCGGSAASGTADPVVQILVMGGVFSGQGPAMVAHRLTAAIWQEDQFAELQAAARAAKAPPGSVAVHLEIDTGMSRQGAAPEQTAALLHHFAPGSPLRLEAVMTHLYASDEPGGAATAGQLARLEDALRILQVSGCMPEYVSVGASAALLGPEAGCIAALAARWGIKALMRPGLALYGVVPRYSPAFPASDEPSQLAKARHQLAPVLAWKTRVETVREVVPGTHVGYNGTFFASEPMRVALVPAGYADGVARCLGNRFHLLVRGHRAPMIGRVSMDQTTLDVTEIPGVKAGDEVVLIGAQEGETVTAFDHADACDTIPWEVFTRIGPRVARIGI